MKSGVALALARESLALRAAHAESIVIANAVSVPAELGFICRREHREEPPLSAAMAVVEEVWHGGDRGAAQ